MSVSISSMSVSSNTIVGFRKFALKGRMQKVKPSFGTCDEGDVLVGVLRVANSLDPDQAQRFFSPFCET